MVSVLLSVYNCETDFKTEAHLTAAVLSIIDQTYTDWEMILYDDGSDAKGKEAIAGVVTLDPRIRHVVSMENYGLAYGLNESLKLARGRYIARMDDDDISSPDRFARQVAFLEEHPEYQWVGCCMELTDEGGIWGCRRFPEIPESRDFLKFSPYPHPAVMFRRETLDQAEGYRKRQKAEDYELFMRLHASGLQGYNLQEVLYYYREDRKISRPLKYASRIEEVRVRRRGYRQLGIMSPKAWPFVLKPLVVGLLPNKFSARYKHWLRKEAYVEGHNSGESEQIQENTKG